MADTKISALPSASTPLAGTEVLPIVQSGVTDQVSVSNLTAGRTVTVGRITATASVGTPSSNAQYGYGAAQGAVITGTGTTYDVQLQNKTNQNVVAIPTGTRDLSLAAGNLVIGTSGKGIDFSATGQAAGMTSELLADYEEGTWTPTIEGSTTPGTQTYSVQVAKYTKVGRSVTVYAYVSITAKDAGIAGNIRIGGLPFTSDSTANALQAFALGDYQGVTFGASKTQLLLRVPNNTTKINVYDGGSGLASAQISVTNMNNATYFVVGGTYQTS